MEASIYDQRGILPIWAIGNSIGLFTDASVFLMFKFSTSRSADQRFPSEATSNLSPLNYKKQLPRILDFGLGRPFGYVAAH
jgi:hypothetical protein